MSIFGKKTTAEEQKAEIQELGLAAIKNYFKIDVNKTFKPEMLRHLHQQAKLGLSFEREQNLNRRQIENNYIRIFKSIAENKAELRTYIKKSMPKYFEQAERPEDPKRT